MERGPGNRQETPFTLCTSVSTAEEAFVRRCVPSEWGRQTALPAPTGGPHPVCHNRLWAQGYHTHSRLAP